MTKDKSSEIHIGKSIIKSGDCEKLRWHYHWFKTSFLMHKGLAKASQAIYKWRWFSSMMSSFIFYIQIISFIILLLDFKDFYFFFLD